MKRTRLMLLGALLIVLAGCNSSPNPISQIITTEGFEAFDTPRTFHGPGTVLRRSPNNRLYFVGILEVPIVKGNESFPEQRKTRNLKLSTVLKTMGIPEENLPNEFELLRDRTVQVSITPFDGYREMVDDRYTKELDGFFAQREVYETNEYYIIRETISSQEIHLHTTDNSLSRFRVDAQVKSWVESDSSVEFDNSNYFGFSKKFGRPMRILYKPERLSIAKRPGFGPIQFEVSVQKVFPGELLISEDVSGE